MLCSASSGSSMIDTVARAVRVMSQRAARVAVALNRMISDPTRPIAEQTLFLLSELVALYEADDLLSTDNTVIVAAREAWPENQGLAAYIC